MPWRVQYFLESDSITGPWSYVTYMSEPHTHARSPCPMASKGQPASPHEGIGGNRRAEPAAAVAGMFGPEAYFVNHPSKFSAAKADTVAKTYDAFLMCGRGLLR